LDAILQLFVDELKDAQNNGVALELPNGQTETHYVLLSAVFADEPASKKMSHWKQHGANLGCGYCAMRGEWMGGAMRFLPRAAHGTYAPGK
jgi:hypothetical protein